MVVKTIFVSMFGKKENKTYKNVTAITEGTGVSDSGLVRLDLQFENGKTETTYCHYFEVK